MGGDTSYQMWITYAGNDTEAWKCIGLGRSLKRTFTTRQLGVIISNDVSQEMGELLESEFLLCRRIHGRQKSQDEKDLQFRSSAKLHIQRIPQLKRIVFLDCNCIVVKNCDYLFRQNNVQLVNLDVDECPFAAILGISTFGQNTAQELTNIIMEIENDKNNKKITILKLEKKYAQLSICVEVDVTSKYPQPLNGDDVKIVCFITGGHPMESLCETKDTFQDELTSFWNSLGVRPSPGVFPAIFSETGPAWASPELNNSVAIVGMACRYPGANNIDEFWKLLEDGIDGIVRVPECRWTKENSFVMMDDVRKTQAGFLSCQVDMFDAKFFNTNQADLGYLDPQQRLALKVVWEALEHARIDPASLRNTITGVFGGWWRNDYKEILQLQGIGGADFLRMYMGNSLGPMTARISHFFDLIGPALSTESGCSTSIAGVDMACDSLRNESCDSAIVVGVNLLLHPFSLGGGNVEGILSPDGRCKTFDASANGFGRAEGAGVLILKRFPDAVAHGDRIWGLIRGSAVVQEGSSRSMGTPTIAVEAAAMELAIGRAGVDPQNICFIETHGTGTPVGDPIEVAAIAQAYGGRQLDNPLIIGSVKTNIGHTESVCGIAGIQKTVLAMKNNKIPRHLHLNNLNPDIDITSIPAMIPMDNIPWLRKNNSTPRIAGVNSFGITGAQAHVVIQDPPEIFYQNVNTLKDTRELRILTFSARTETSLSGQIEKYSIFLKHSNHCPKNIEYTMHVGRSHFPIRQTAIGSTNEELLNSIKEMQPASTIPSSTPKLCFLFTGQGSQYLQMGRQLFESSVVFRSNFQRLNGVLKNTYGFSITENLWNEQGDLTTTMASQTSIFFIEICLLRLWESWGIVPDAVIGHSLGEFAAMVAAGILNVDDALKLVVVRSQLIDALPSSSMLVVASSLENVLSYLDKHGNRKDRNYGLDIAAVNSTGQTVIAGDASLIEDFNEICFNNGVKTHRLDSNHAFHSRLMDPMLNKYKDVATTIKFNLPQINYISGVEGKSISKINVEYLLRHTRQRVNFLDATHHAIKGGYELYLEIGPHPVLCSLVMINGEEISNNLRVLPSVRRNMSDWTILLSSLAKLYTWGIPINWENFHRFSQAEKVDLPGYTFDETSHWVSITDTGSVPFHPLLGSYFPNASENTIFESSVNVQRVPFLNDHRLGDRIIFPCTGFVDMCITAGYASVKCDEGSYVKPISAIALNNFEITSPLCLSETESIHFQVVVNTSNQGDIFSTVYTRLQLEQSKFKWVKNAHAKFDLTPPPPEPSILNFSQIRGKVCKPENLNFNYDRFKEVSQLRLGPSCLTVHENGWKNPENDSEYLFTFKCHETQEDLDRFIIHPWITDTVLQIQGLALTTLRNPDIMKAKLLVPVQIEKVVWWGHSAQAGYIYTKINYGYNESHIYDNDGRLMASIINVELVETSFDNIMALVDSHRNPYPTLAEYHWNENTGPEERRISNEDRGSISLHHFFKSVHVCAEFTPDEDLYHKSWQHLAGLYMLKGFVELDLTSHKSFTWPEISEQIRVLPRLKNFLRYILLELKNAGYIQLDMGLEQDDRALCFIHSPGQDIPTLETVCTYISAIEDAALISHKEWYTRDIRVVQMWSNLANILTGHMSTLDFLVDTTEEKDGQKVVGLTFPGSLLISKRQALHPLLSKVLDMLSRMRTKSIIRILEVGGGVIGNMNNSMKSMLEIGGAHFHYTYTDSVADSLQNKEKLFIETDISATYSIFDINEDPLAQGMIPRQYDIIFASWVLHATKDLEKSINHLKLLLKPNGYLLVEELLQPARDVMMSFGGLDEFWAFGDCTRRTWNCHLSLDGWYDLLRLSGFDETVGVATYEGVNGLIMAKLGNALEINTFTSLNSDEISKHSSPTWIVFVVGERTSLSLKIQQKVLNIGQNCKSFATVDIDCTTLEIEICKILSLNIESTVGIVYMCEMDAASGYRETCEPLLYICKYLAEARTKNSLKLITVTNGCMCTGPSDYEINVPVSSPIISMVQVLGNENTDYICKAVDVDFGENMDDEIFYEMFHWDIDTMVAYRNGKRYLPRLKNYKVKNTKIDVPMTKQTRLVIPPTFDIGDLHFIPYTIEEIPDEHVEIEIKAYSINFLDLLMVTKPDSAFDSINHFGIDMAGIISKVGIGCTRFKMGDRVVCLRRTGDALPSHYNAHEESVIRIPNNMTFNDAATLPLAAITVLYSLSYLTKATANDTILIHTASGGVGLLAIQAAQQIGCAIVATAGTTRKRNYLKTLGLKYVFNSRTTEYQKEVRDALGGRGVSIVLNSLTGEGFKEATLSLCDDGACFIEMSKMNVWAKREVQNLRPDVKYHIMDVSKLPDSELRILVTHLRAQFAGQLEDRECPTPLPYTRYESCHIKEALEYIEKVKHVGKVVVTMPEHTRNNDVPTYTMFHDEGTYLITGGLGGIGFQVAKWMICCGATKLILIGRSLPTPETIQGINALQLNGTQINIRQCDVGDRDQLKVIFDEVSENFPIRGIIHAAGILDDAILENQTWTMFERVYRSKVQGGWNLHLASLQLKFPLEHFVVFSSMAATISAPGQCNYASANYYLDSLIHYRNSLGLPGLTINSGNWDNVGLAASLTHAIIKPFSGHQGLAALEYAMKTNKTQIIPYEGDLGALKKLLISTRALFSNIMDTSEIGTSTIDGEKFWIDYDTAVGEDGRTDILRGYIKQILRHTLKMIENDKIDDDANFQSLGMDSLMMVEMKNGLQSSVGKRVKISINAVKDCKTVNELAGRLVDLISGNEPIPILNGDELRDLVISDSKLLDNISVGCDLASTLCPMNKVSTVLITGVTGTLGPYLLRELRYKYPSIKKVYCLVKPSSLFSANDRFHRSINLKNVIPRDELDDWVEIIPGDVGKETMGMNATTYSKVSSEVEAIFNLSAYVSLPERYSTHKTPNSSRTVNVQGFKNVLEFAVADKLKYVYHVSSWGAEQEVDQDYTYKETWPNLGQVDRFPNSAYIISKLICDHLAQQAVSRGIPCKIFRMPNIGGDSITGGNVPLESFQMQRFLVYMYLGFMLAEKVPLCMMPVDLCAEFSLKLFFMEDTPYEMYNVINPHLGDEIEFPEIAKELGVKIEVLNREEFFSRVKKLSDGNDPMNEYIKQITEYEVDHRKAIQDPPPIYFYYLLGKKDITWSRKLAQYIPDVYPSKIMSSWDILRKDLELAKKTGIFDKYNIKYD